MEQMHAVGVRHNDLHARNVVRNSHGELRIIDFGYASFSEGGGDDRWKGDDEG